jgi:membrane-bound lytic murein transglycosylase B
MRILRVVAVLAAAACAALVVAAPAPAASSSAPPSYAKRDDVRQFIAAMVQRHGFTKKQLESVFSRVQAQPAVLKSMTLAPESSRAWQNYRAIFVNAQRIEAGVRFWNRHAPALERASAEFGVPEEVVLGIIGVETTYGRNMGSYRVIDALTTLAFDSPNRGEFFRSQLESYLLYTRETKTDVFRMKGSYAGAIGIPQFMPGSYRQYAIDYDGDGRKDLADSPADAIGSVANFLREHGWQRGQAAAVPAAVDGAAARLLVDSGFKPLYRAADLPSFGVKPSRDLGDDTLCALIELESPGQPSEYWVGLQNFYVLTRYNRASFYGIAVLELGRAVKEARAQQAAAEDKPAEKP